MSGISDIYLVAVTLVVATGLWFFFRHGPISRRPDELILYPPKGETFPNGRAFLHFLMPYGYNIGLDMPEDKAFTAAADNPKNFSIFGVPENAKLTAVRFYLIEDGKLNVRIYQQTFWPKHFRLSESAADAQSITFLFSVPGEESGISRQFRLV